MPSASEIRALVSLLSDDDPRITNLVWENLTRMGSDAFPALREATDDADPRLRARARHALDHLAFELIAAGLRRQADVSEAEFDLEGALHALARLDRPDLLRDGIGHQLEALARRIQPRLTPEQCPLERIGAANAVLFGELRFAATPRSQAEASDFALDRVLERRRGAPVLLAAVYLLVADRLGLGLRAVGLPSHILLRHQEGEDEVFLDPSRAGRIFRRAECVRTYLRDYYPRDSYIHEAGGRDVAIRAVRGMMLLCARTQDRTRARRLGRLLEILQARERAH